MSAWSGLRPLVRDPNKKDTKSLARNHVIEVSKSGLVTIAGLQFLIGVALDSNCTYFGIDCTANHTRIIHFHHF